MTPAVVGFWLAGTLVLYTYVAYPLVLALAARLRPRRPQPAGRFEGTVTVILAAYNEEATIGRRVSELVGLLAGSGLQGEIIVISDGSTDRTAEQARAIAGPVRVIELPVNGGKSAALNEGHAAAGGAVLVLADARQTWADDAMRRLADNFLDPAVGAVSGDLIVEAPPGVVSGMVLYWRYEKWIRQMEGRFHSTIGVTGAISAVRRELFRPIPRGIILDDLYWPLEVAMRGGRVVHDEEARAYDRLPARARDEFWRKVRTLSGNFQLLAWRPTALLPWKNAVWWQFVSHKVLRLAMPWALLVLLGTSAVLSGPLYRGAFWAQAAAYLLALAGLWDVVATRSRVASAAGSFVVLNAAAWVAFWVWAFGGAGRSWGKVAYSRRDPTESTGHCDLPENVPPCDP